MEVIVDGIVPTDIIEVVIRHGCSDGIVIKVLIHRVDITFVDRRTMEQFRRFGTTKRNPRLITILGSSDLKNLLSKQNRN